MSKVPLGPRAAGTFRRLGQSWEQTQHVIISGGTGSGKTTIARHVVQQRINRGGFVVVFIFKLRTDQTVLDEYAGWTRWERMKRRPGPHENRVLLWPNTDKMTVDEAVAHQKRVFTEAINILVKVGRWTLVVDEGLYMCDPAFLGMSRQLAMLHYLGRSSGLTVVTNTQRPSHLPVVIYGSVGHALVSRTQEPDDVKRLANLGGRTNSRILAARISELERREFLWIPVADFGDPKVVNVAV